MKHVPSCVQSGNAESDYPPGRFLIFSDNVAPVLALCKGRSTLFYTDFVIRRIFASGFGAGFVLSFKWTPSELNYSDKGSRFFDRDCDPSKFPSSCSCTKFNTIFTDTDKRFSFTDASGPSDYLPNFTGHAAAVSAHWPSVSETGDCIGGLGKERCHDSFAPLTCGELPPGFVGSQLLDESQMQWSSAGSGTEARHARSPTKIDENCSSCSNSGASSRRQAPVESES